MSDLGLWGPGAELAWWPIIVGAVVNTSCALLGCLLVLRRLSLLGDAISHSVLPGIVGAFLIAQFLRQQPFIYLFAGALIGGMLTTFLVETLHRYVGVAEDAGMGVVFTALFSVGVIMLSNYARDVHLDATCVLYGEIGTLAFRTTPIFGFEVPEALPRMIAALAAVVVFLIVLRKELLIASFDPALATAMGFSSAALHYALMGMTAVVTVAAFEAIGSILVVAMLVVPAATAHLLTDRLGRMFVWSAVLAVSASFLGYLFARRWNTDVAGMMTVAAGAQFALAVLFAPRHGVVAKAWRTAALTIRIAGEDVLARHYRGEETAQRPVLAGTPAVAPPIESGFVALLARRLLLYRGELKLTSMGTVLTDRGRRAAESLVRAHRLWEAYLVENFQLPLDHLHEPAEKIEHFLGPELQQRLAESLPKTDLDPHGREIPKGATPSN